MLRFETVSSFLTKIKNVGRRRRVLSIVFVIAYLQKKCQKSNVLKKVTFSGVSASEYTFDDDDDDWLGRTQRCLLELTAPRVRVIPPKQQQNKIEKRQKDKNTKRQKDKNTKIQIQNTNTKYRLQKKVKNHPSYKK